MYFKLFLLVLCALIGTSCGFRCYTCSFSQVDVDRSCLTITNDTRTVDCPFTYCTIQRQEFLDPEGSIASFTRGCEDRPVYLNHEVEDFHFRTYYRACTSDLCNFGNGIQAVGGGVLAPRPEYTGENLLVPGTGRGNGAGNIKITPAILLLSVLLAYFQ